MNINSANYVSLSSFEGKKKHSCRNNDAPKKKIPALASYLIPGTGQFMNGENKKGAKYLGIDLGLGVMLTAVVKLTQLSSMIKNPPKLIKPISANAPLICGLAFGAGIIGSLINRIVSSVNAYRGR